MIQMQMMENSATVNGVSMKKPFYNLKIYLDFCFWQKENQTMPQIEKKVTINFLEGMKFN